MTEFQLPQEATIKTRDLPAIRVAVTELCNLKCQYCPTDGDSVQMQKARMSDDQFEGVLDMALEQGFPHYSFTGGEPLLSPSTTERTRRLASFVNNKKDELGLSGYTKLNTNGARLVDFEDEVVSAGFTELKVSLDTLKPETFQEVARRGKDIFDKTIDGIELFAGRIPIRIQMVVGNYNKDEVKDMIAFCREKGISLKLFDITSYDNALAGSGDYAMAGYVPLDGYRDQLEAAYGEPFIRNSKGGYGHPKRVYTTPEGTEIEVRDNAQGTHFAKDLCGSCPSYPCSEGISNIVVASDGHLRFCREGGADQTIPSQNEKGELYSAQELREHFARAAGIFAAAAYQKTVSKRIPVRIPLFVEK
jgi:molybdenum cofactor biosynthesis enzyme MoaA